MPDPLRLPDPFASLPMAPLRVTAELRTPVACYETVMLDALLAAAHFDELRRRHLVQGALAAQRALAQERGTKAAGASIEIPIPLARVEHEGRPIWSASAGLFSDERAESVQIWHKRFEDDDRIRYRSATPKVTVTNGYFRGYAMPLVIHSAPALIWFARGHAEQIEQLVSAVTHVGKKISQGYGEVRRWRVEAVADDWSLAREGRVMRPLPRAYAEAHGWAGTPRWMPTRPPYWDMTLCEEALTP